MDNTFLYRRAGQDLYAELTERTSLGHSSILLGMHGIGKTHCLRAVEQNLKQEDASHIILIDFRDTKPVTDPAELSRRIRARIVSAVKGADKYLPKSSSRRLLEGFEWLSRQPRKVVLLASNVDSLSHSLTQRVLREARYLVTARKLTVIFTGEDQLAPLVIGDGSEFNCGQHYLIQGFDEREFHTQMCARLMLPGIPCPDPDECLKVLWEQTGGNSVIGRAALWLLHELQVRTGDHPELNPDMMKNYLKGVPVPDTLGMDAFHRISRVILRRYDCWENLVNLINKEYVTVQPGGLPTGLEFAGLAVRDHEHLMFASPVVERIARNYYDDGRLGDLFASRGEWEDAFTLYARLTPERRMRPLGQEDQARLQLVVKSFAASFHARATENAGWSHAQWKDQHKKLQDLLARGCKLILGVRHVLFWSRHESDWVLEGEDCPADTPTDTAKIMLNILVQKKGNASYERLLTEYGLVDTFPSATSGEPLAVALLDGPGGGAMAKNRLDLLEEILQAFRLAWTHLLSSGFNQRHLEQRKQHLAVATKILRVIGTHFNHPQEAFQEAGDQLLAMGYRRIFFSLVETADNCIRGFLDCKQDHCPKADFLSATKFAINDPMQDIQPWVVGLQEPLLIPDWRVWNENKPPGHPLINEDLCRKARTAQSFAVVPMIREISLPDGTTNNRVIGTIHVERENWRELCKEDVADLMEFGSLMTLAIGQVEQSQAVKKALELDLDSVIVITPAFTIRLANDKAAEWLELPEGWRKKEHISLDLSIKAQSLVHKLVAQVSKTRKQQVLHQVSSLPEGQSKREFIRCSPLPAWSPQLKPGETADAPPIGYVIEIRDLSPIERIRQAMEIVAAKASGGDDLIEGVLNAVEHLSYKHARYYKVKNNELVSARARGLSPEQTAHFASGGMRMTIDEAKKQDTWRCLQKREPCIHQFEPDGKNGNMAPTKHGLKRRSYKKPGFHFPDRKRGHIWIDLPLFANGKPHGKIAIDCGHDDCDLTAEEYELLRLFSSILGTLLDGIERLDHKEQWAHEAIDNAIIKAAHHLRNQLSGMLGFYNCYEEAAPDNAQIKEWNSIFRPCFDSTEQLLDSTLDVFKDTVKIAPETFLVLPAIKQALASKGFSSQPPGQKQPLIICDPNLKIQADKAGLAIALEELITNSTNMMPHGLQIQIEVQEKNRLSGTVTEILIKDNGPGLDPNIGKSAFDLLVSSNPNGRRGTGLGLAHVRRIMAAHEGSVSFLLPPPASWGAVLSLIFPVLPGLSR